MADPVIRRIREQTLRTGVAVAWAQWSALTTMAVPAGPRARSMVDPEALVLLSLAVRGREPRLDDLVLGWARAASSLLSVQRVLHLAEAFPPGVREGIGGFARAAADAGDRRWRAHAAETEAGPAARRKVAGAPRLAEAPALMLRLRAGFGVGTRADVLAFLLAQRGGEATVSTLSEATGYSGSAVRTAVEEMVLAGFVRRLEGSPTAYCADHRAWAGVLLFRPTSSPKGPDAPPWRFWAAIFAFLADLEAWAAEAEAAEWSPYVASSRARDLVEDHARTLRMAKLRLPDPREPGGAVFLEDLERGMKHVHEWCLQQL
ncbi:MAG TPA: MarR family transcriptional regulator [Longimicrobium sp.]|nr:MarR family transcriptional regulator [Longimicrobium sp.]